MMRVAKTVKKDETVQRVPKGQAHPYVRWEGTPLWRAVEKAVADLVQNKDLVEGEYREYIVGYICKIANACFRQLSRHRAWVEVDSATWSAIAEPIAILTESRSRSFCSTS